MQAKKGEVEGKVESLYAEFPFPGSLTSTFRMQAKKEEVEGKVEVLYAEWEDLEALLAS